MFTLPFAGRFSFRERPSLFLRMVFLLRGCSSLFFAGVFSFCERLLSFFCGMFTPPLAGRFSFRERPVPFLRMLFLLHGCSSLFFAGVFPFCERLLSFFVECSSTFAGISTLLRISSLHLQVFERVSESFSGARFLCGAPRGCSRGRCKGRSHPVAGVAGGGRKNVSGLFAAGRVPGASGELSAGRKSCRAKSEREPPPAVPFRACVPSRSVISERC